MASKSARATLSVPADHSEYPRVQAFIEGTCAQAGCSDVQRLRVLLVIEELFTNTVKYGRSAPAISVTISVEAEGASRLAVHYDDTAPRYDPFERTDASEDLTTSITNRRIGGIGIVLVRELGHNVQYAWSGGRNRLTFIVPLALPPRIDP